jgi:hypothetical protein
MSRRWWGGGAVSLLGLFLSVAYLSDWQRIWLSWLFGIGIIVCVVMAIVTKKSKKDNVGVTAKVSGHHVTQNVAGRDAIHSVHHYHSGHAEPFGMRVDASALRDFKNHRDNGEKILQSIRPHDGSSGAEWAKIDEWWTEAIAKANQNVFAPFLTLKDLATLREPWPGEDKLSALARAVDAGQIKDNDDDSKLYLCHWERLERLRQLIGIIESKG